MHGSMDTGPLSVSTTCFWNLADEYAEVLGCFCLVCLGLVCFPLLLACLSSFTNWCTAHRQQFREQKKNDEYAEVVHVWMTPTQSGGDGPILLALSQRASESLAKLLRASSSARL